LFVDVVILHGMYFKVTLAVWCGFIWPRTWTCDETVKCVDEPFEQFP